MASLKKKFLVKWFAHAISVHYWDFEHAYVYWIWLCSSAGYVIKLYIKSMLLANQSNSYHSYSNSNVYNNSHCLCNVVHLFFF